MSWFSKKKFKKIKKEPQNRKYKKCDCYRKENTIKHTSAFILKGSKTPGLSILVKKKVLSYFDKIHPVVSVITCRPCLRAFQPAHEHTKAVALRQGRRSFISAVRSMKDVHGWSRVSQGFVLGRVHLFVSTTFKANVHEHEHEASWVTGPLKNSTMVLPIIHRAQCSCGISYMALCVFLCVYLCLREGVCMLYLHVWRCKALICKYVSGYICACSITQCVSLYVRECVFPLWSYVLNLVNFYFFSLFCVCVWGGGYFLKWDINISHIFYLF